MIWFLAAYLLVLAYASMNQERVAYPDELAKAWFWFAAVFLVQGLLASGLFGPQFAHFLFGEQSVIEADPRRDPGPLPGILVRFLIGSPYFFAVISLLRFSRALVPRAGH